jgi:predicted dehydrogenase
VVGDRGDLRVLNPVTPQFFHRLSVRSADGNRVERFPRRASYAYQLDGFAAAVLRGEPVKTTPEDAIENMTVIDGLNANPFAQLALRSGQRAPDVARLRDATTAFFNRLSGGEMHLVHVRSHPQGVGRDR